MDQPTFIYKIIDGQLYLSIDNDRILIRWNERWVPENAEVVGNPEEEIEGNTLELSDYNDIEENALIINKGEIEGNFLVFE